MWRFLFGSLLKLLHKYLYGISINIVLPKPEGRKKSMEPM